MSHGPLRRLWRAVAAVLTVTAMMGGVGAAPARSVAPRVLVMPFGVAVDAGDRGRAEAALWVGHAAALVVTEDLAALGIGAISRGETARAFDRLQLPLSASLTRATTIRVAELLGASEVVVGEARLGADLQLSARIIRLRSGAFGPDVSAAGGVEQVQVLSRELGRQLAPHLDAVTVPRPLADPMPFEVFENYIRGLVAITPAAQQRFLERAMARAPRDARVLIALWPVYSGQSAHEKALAVASAVPRDSPRSREARFAAGLSLLELRRYDAAALELAALHREQPAAAVSNALGIVALRRGARDAAATPASYFRRAVEEAPGMADYLFNLGYAQAIAGDRANALLWLREAVRVGPANGDAHLVMSAVLAAAGRAVEAGRELDLARLLGSAAPVPAAPEPGVPAGLERVRGDLDASPVDRARVWTNAPASEDQHEAAAFELARGRRFVEAGRDREAADALRRAVYLAPYEDEAHLLLGRLYRRAGRLQDAIDEFKVALWCRETAAARVALGDALFDSGDRDGARREADRALALQPGDADARMLLARIGGGPPMLPSPEFHD